MAEITSTCTSENDIGKGCISGKIHAFLMSVILLLLIYFDTILTVSMLEKILSDMTGMSYALSLSTWFLMWSTVYTLMLLSLILGQCIEPPILLTMSYTCLCLITLTFHYISLMICINCLFTGGGVVFFYYYCATYELGVFELLGNCLTHGLGFLLRGTYLDHG